MSDDLDRLVAQAQKLLAFPDQGRVVPLTISVDEARRTFRPVNQLYDMLTGMQQAGRCGSCATPFCSTGVSEVQIGCPLENNIPDWLELLARGQVRDAVAEAFRTNPMPDVTGAVCPHSDLCEGSCVLKQAGWGAVTIGSIELLLGETAWRHNLVPPIVPKYDLDTSVGVIGTGPGGYAVATRLAELGHHVTLYDRHPTPGGLLAYGIPGFKLDKGVVARHFNRLAAAERVNIVCGTSIGQPQEGRDVPYTYKPFSELVDEHDAVVIATGTYRPKNARLEGDAASSVVPAIDFLTTQNYVDRGDHVPGFGDGWINARGKRVFVIGGGDTMVDCLRTAIRQEARSVTCLYYRGPDDIPATRKDLERALAEGAEVLYFTSAKGLERNGEGPFSIHAVNTRLTGRTDKWDRPEIEEVPGSEHMIEGDMVVSAVGFDPEQLPLLFNINGMQLTRQGVLDVTPVHNPRPDRPGAGIVGRAFTESSSALVTAVGDIVRGPSLVVQALRDGRDLSGFLHDALIHPERIETKWGAPDVMDLRFMD